LEADGIVTTEIENIGKRVRKYYKLTQKGEGLAKVVVDEFIEFMESIKNILESKQHLSGGYGVA
jgi:DNA-binding PadR family transcriptional regulator